MPRIANPTRKGRILGVTVQQKVDEFPDFSDIGQHTDTPQGWAILRVGEHRGTFIIDLPEDAELPPRGREFRFFIPFAGGEKPGTDEYRRYGLQDFERMEANARNEWWHIGIIAVAAVTLPGSNIIQRISSGGIWGVESDSDRDDLLCLATEELEALRGELTAIGFGDRAIEAGCRTVKMPF